MIDSAQNISERVHGGKGWVLCTGRSQAIVALGALVVGRWIKVIYNAGIGPKYWSQEQRTGWRLD